MVVFSSDLCAPWIGFTEVHRIEKYAGLLEPQIAPYLMVASEICYKLSGRAFPGVCELVGLRPCRRPAMDRHPTRPLPPFTWSPLWWGWCTCGGTTWDGDCACQAGLYALDLDPFTPVVSIDEVRIDGVALLADEYTVLDWRHLVRADGVWPASQRLDLPDTEVGTWAVDLHYGAPVPEDAQLAAATLAGELALAANPGAGDCILPERIQSVTRQGLTYVLLDPQTFLESGRTGIYLVDLWLRATNPHGTTRGAVLSYPGQPGVPGRFQRP